MHPVCHRSRLSRHVASPMSVSSKRALRRHNPGSPRPASCSLNQASATRFVCWWQMGREYQVSGVRSPSNSRTAPPSSYRRRMDQAEARSARVRESVRRGGAIGALRTPRDRQALSEIERASRAEQRRVAIPNTGSGERHPPSSRPRRESGWVSVHRDTTRNPPTGTRCPGGRRCRLHTRGHRRTRFPRRLRTDRRL
jgi:hypothetical protein